MRATDTVTISGRTLDAATILSAGLKGLLGLSDAQVSAAAEAALAAFSERDEDGNGVDDRVDEAEAGEEKAAKKAKALQKKLDKALDDGRVLQEQVDSLAAENETLKADLEKATAPSEETDVPSA